MQVNGKTWDITAEDLVSLAKAYGIRRPKGRFQQIIDAVGRWPEFGKEAGVPKEEMAGLLNYILDGWKNTYGPELVSDKCLIELLFRHIKDFISTLWALYEDSFWYKKSTENGKSCPH
jgi:hypothetical protein